MLVTLVIYLDVQMTLLSGSLYPEGKIPPNSSNNFLLIRDFSVRSDLNLYLSICINFSSTFSLSAFSADPSFINTQPFTKVDSVRQ